jgi:hypothetical protein
MLVGTSYCTYTITPIFSQILADRPFRISRCLRDRSADWNEKEKLKGHMPLSLEPRSTHDLLSYLCYCNTPSLPGKIPFVLVSLRLLIRRGRCFDEPVTSSKPPTLVTGARSVAIERPRIWAPNRLQLPTRSQGVGWTSHFTIGCRRRRVMDSEGGKKRCSSPS